VVSGGVVVVSSKFGGSCKEALRDDVYEALFHDLYPKNTALGKHAQSSKHPSHTHSQACKVERSRRGRFGRRMSTVQYARLGKENGSSKSAKAKQVKSFGVRRVPPASGVSGRMRPGTKPCLGKLYV